MHKDIVLKKLTKRISQNLWSPEALTSHCERMSQTYFDRFKLEDIEKHIILVDRLLKGETFCCEWKKSSKKQRYELTLISYDYSWLTVALTGYLVMHRFDIRKGNVFTYTEECKEKTSYRESRKKVVNVLEVVYCGEEDLLLKNQKAFEDDMQLFFEKLSNNDVEAFKGCLMNQIGSFLDQKEMINFPIMPIDIDILVKNEYIKINIKAADTPFFLFTLLLALKAQKIEVIDLLINTLDQNVYDVLTVRDTSKRLYRHSEELHKFKVAIAFIKYFTYCLPLAPDAYQAFRCFEMFLDQIWEKKDFSKQLMSFLNMEDLSLFAKIFGSGAYLWEQFLKIQYKAFVPFVIKNQDMLYRYPLKEKYEDLCGELKKVSNVEIFVDKVNQFKDECLFDLDMRQLIYPHYSFRDFGSDLSFLAQKVVMLIANFLYKELCAKKGTPQFEGRECGFALMRLGKWGGDELGYASDLEMVMIYEGYGDVTGELSLTNQAFFNLLIQKIKKCIRVKRQGIFEIDLRLRPDGEKGELAVSFNRWRKYYSEKQARSYEVQSLVKMDSICGTSKNLIEKIMQARDDILYNGELDPVPEFIKLRKQQKESLVHPRKKNVKFSSGGLVDIEYAIQMLQIKHGKHLPALRTPRTLKAMGNLLRNGYISPADYEYLSNAYSFLRRMINALRMVRGNAKDLVVPDLQSDEFLFLARRMKYKSEKGLLMQEVLEKDIEYHMGQVSDFVQKTFVDKSTNNKSVLTVSDIIFSKEEVSSDLVNQILASYKFDNSWEVYKSIRKMYKFVEHKNHFLALLLMILRQIEDSPDPDKVLFLFERLFTNVSIDICREWFYEPKILDMIISVFGHSDFLSQIILNDPMAMEEIFHWESKNVFQNHQGLKIELDQMVNNVKDMADYFDKMRRFRNKVILRIALRDFFDYAKFSQVVQEISSLADVIIDHAFQKILSFYEILHLYDSQVIIALGKLGGQELNYSSDIDLIFIIDDDINDADRKALLKANQDLIEYIMDKSIYFQLYRIDMRLRPYGSFGSLIVKESICRKYYENNAQGWELQAWLKARGIAGNLKMGRNLIKDIQDKLLDNPRRPEIEKSMKKMRQKKLNMLDKNGVLATDIKSGDAGIRKIELFIQALQINHASIYPDLISGNTVYVLKCLQHHGILECSFVNELKKDYIFLRRVEHCLQVLGMQQTHIMPNGNKELLKLAKRMRYIDFGRNTAVKAFLKDFTATRERLLALK